MSKCANCGTELEPGTKFCSQCGKPVPQTKVCPGCGSEQKPEAKFCSNCGHRFGAPAADGGGADMGLKIGHSTVMGDISNTVNHVTNVTNADETKKVVKCHVCGKVLSVVGTHECPKCHGNVCDEHFDLVRKMCTACVEQVQKEGEAAFRQTIREELTAGGGRITQDAFGRLRQKRMALGLDEARGRELIAAERRAEAPADGTVLTDVQRRFLERAKHLIFNDGKCAEGVAEIDRLLGSGVALGDEILAVLMPALLVCDEKRGDQIAERTLVDSLPVALYWIDRALLHGDLISAEKSLIGAEGIWPDEILVKCRRVVFTCALYDESEDESYSDKAAELFDALPQEDADETDKDSLTASWRRYASNRVDLILGNGDEIEPLDEDDGRCAALVYGRLTEPCGGPMRMRRAEILHDEGRDFYNEESWEDAVRCFHEAAEAGHADAQNWLGHLYYNGQGVPQSYEEASKWYRKAADQGNQYAQSNLAGLYEDGKCVAQSYEEAVKWYRKSAEQGLAHAQDKMGVMYEDGKGVAQSYEEAVKWYRKSAEQGHAHAQAKMGVMYERGWGVLKSYEEAAKWYRKAADQGRADAQKILGFMYHTGRGVAQSDEEAVKWYRKSAEQGEAEAQRYLGAMCWSGSGVVQSYEEAAKWFRKAAERGDADAQRLFGLLHETGQGVAQSYEEAAKWYRKAAEQGLAHAQWNLASLYEEGQGVAQSYEEAAKWYRKAADQGHDDAQWRLARLYGKGLGVPQSYDEAAKWCRKAADQGHDDAQWGLAYLHEKGQGVPQSYEEAVKWFQTAARQGHERAQKKLQDKGISW